MRDILGTWSKSLGEKRRNGNLVIQIFSRILLGDVLIIRDILVNSSILKQYLTFTSQGNSTFQELDTLVKYPTS